VGGSPIPSVAWVHKGQGEVTMSLRRRVVELSGGTTSLTIAELGYEDGGVYICTAINNLGTVSASCELTVLGKDRRTLEREMFPILFPFIIYHSMFCGGKSVRNAVEALCGLTIQHQQLPCLNGLAWELAALHSSESFTRANDSLE